MVFVLALLVIGFGRALWRDRDLRREMHALENEVTKQEAEQERMHKLVAYLKSPDFIEAEARTTYGFAKPGEQVVVFQESANVGKTTVSRGKTNAAKWFSYFFEQAEK